MSKHQKDNGIITPEGPKPEYDFAFIAGSLGLIPIDGIAFNQGAITLMEVVPNGVQMVIHGEHEIELSHVQMAELQAMILARIKAMESAKSGKPGNIVIPDFVKRG